MSLEQAQAIGAKVTINKTLSEADIALFLLVTNETTPSGDEPPLTSHHAREAAPLVMLAALLASAAAGHARRPDAARFLQPDHPLLRGGVYRRHRHGDGAGHRARR